jgi:hypothetical protein
MRQQPATEGAVWRPLRDGMKRDGMKREERSAGRLGSYVGNCGKLLTSNMLTDVSDPGFLMYWVPLIANPG